MGMMNIFITSVNVNVLMYSQSAVNNYVSKRVTIKDIAATLGVSIGTVDRALHDRPGIKAETRERVLAQARLMGYETNLIARSLSRKHQLKIGCVFPAEYLFYPDIEAGINAAYESLIDYNV